MYYSRLTDLFVAAVRPNDTSQVDVSDATFLFPALACWPLDNQGSASHLCLAISNKSKHKCRKCLIQAPDMLVPGRVGARRSFEEANIVASLALQALRKKLNGDEPLTDDDKNNLKRCTYMNVQKIPCFFMEKEHDFLNQDPYLLCPYDDLHTLSEGLLKGWVVWSVVCMA